MTEKQRNEYRNRIIDITGQQFGEWTVLGYDEDASIKNHKTMFKCKCSCGAVKHVNSQLLRNGRSKSCGHKNYDDIIGKKFGKLTPLYVDEKKTKEKGKTYFWCKCDCGNLISAYGTQLKSGDIVSCGCRLKDAWRNAVAKTFKDLTGKRFGSLTVIERVTGIEKPGTWWRTKCDCGNEKIVTGGHLTDGHVTNCGCKKDLSETHVGFSDVIRKVKCPDKSTKTAYWLCRCECGNEFITQTRTIKESKWLSCGCRKSEFLTAHTGLYKDISGNKYGHLTAIEIDTERTVYGNTYWKCVCDCGHECSVPLNSLTYGSTKSCGLCGHRSYGEELISHLLDERGIKYVHDKKIHGCIYPETNFSPRFDFFIKDEYVVEYDGQQHFQKTHSVWDEKISLEGRQSRDAFKNQFCFDHNIPIIRIPYTHYNDLCFEDLVPETSPFLLSPEGVNVNN